MVFCASIGIEEAQGKRVWSKVVVFGWISINQSWGSPLGCLPNNRG